MSFVYVLLSQSDGTIYIGSSADPDLRLAQHNAGKVFSTKPHRPWTRVHLENFATRSDAQRREKYLKSGWGRKWLHRKVLSRDARSAGKRDPV